jgi:hypothetical protein
LLTRDKARRIAVDNRQAAGATTPNGTLVSFEVRFWGQNGHDAGTVQCPLLADTVAKVFLPPRSQNFWAMGAFFM